jgi:hypothetical protein
MKTLSLLLLVLFMLPAFAQETKKDSAYIAEYYRLRALYLKSVDAGKNNKSDKLYENFLRKAKFKGTHEEMAQEDGLINWVKQNLDKTEFTNVEEAEKAWNETREAMKNRPAEETEFFNEARKASEVYGRDIILDVKLNRGAGDKDPKTEPDYIAAYQKLKTLMIAHEKSASYLNYKSLLSEFRKRANYDPRKDKYRYPDTLLDWVKANLSKTMFMSLLEAEMEWNKIENAREEDERINSEYEDYNRECLKKYGPYMHSDVLIETME